MFSIYQVCLYWFKHIYLSSIVKQVLSIYIKHSRVCFLEPTSTSVIWRNMVVNQLGLEPMSPWSRGKHLNHFANAPLMTCHIWSRMKCCLNFSFVVIKILSLLWYNELTYCPTILTWHFINFRKGHLNKHWPVSIEYINIFANFTRQWGVVYW
jgi:hypothetical protein